MRVKILNAMAQGIPMVPTTLGYEGIEVTPGRDILVGDTPEAFAAEVLRVLNDPDLGRQLATNGRKLVQGKYDYRNACRPLVDTILARATQKRSAQ
jgi:glycosyltransferase involved in cell wall biosynthesis